MRSKWLLVALVISLSLNLIWAGFALGRHSGGGTLFDPVRGHPGWLRTLPEQRREELRPLVFNHLRGMRGDIRKLRSRNRDVQAALRAEPFDAQQLALALAAMRNHHASVQQQGHESFLALAQALTPGERLAFADYLDQRRHAPPGHHGKPGTAPPAGTGP